MFFVSPCLVSTATVIPHCFYGRQSFFPLNSVVSSYFRCQYRRTYYIVLLVVVVLYPSCTPGRYTVTSTLPRFNTTTYGTTSSKARRTETPFARTFSAVHCASPRPMPPSSQLIDFANVRFALFFYYPPSVPVHVSPQTNHNATIDRLKQRRCSYTAAFSSSMMYPSRASTLSCTEILMVCRCLCILIEYRWTASEPRARRVTPTIVHPLLAMS